MTPGEITEKTSYELFLPDQAEKRHLSFHSVFDTGKKAFTETRLVTSRGEECYANSKIEPVKNEQGRIQWIAGIAGDITERKQSELHLAEKSAEIKAKNEEYLQLNEDLLQFNDELHLAKDRTEATHQMKQHNLKLKIIAQTAYNRMPSIGLMIVRNIFLIYLFLISFNAKSQNFMFFEYEDRITFQKKINHRPQVSIYGEHILNDHKLGTFFYSQANNTWAEGYGGLLYKPTNFCSLYAGIGVETDNTPYRAAFSLSLQNKKISHLQWYEYGGSGFWYNVELNYRFSDRFKAGILCKRFYGSGINIIYNFRNTPISLKYALLYDFEFELLRSSISLRFTYN